MSRAILAASCICLLTVLAGAVRAETVLFDGDFQPADWSDFLLTIDDPLVGGTGPLTAFGSVARQTTGGNPDAYRESTNNLVNGDVSFTGGWYDAVLYDPGTSGAIIDLDFSLDLTGIRSTVGGSSGWQLLLEQGGTTYYSVPAQYFGNSDPWTTHILTGLTQADFDTAFNANAGANQPDFSASGGPIRFGYAIWAGVYGTSTAQLVSGADNFSLTINSVPEPTSFGIALTALAAFGCGAWRIRRTR